MFELSDHWTSWTQTTENLKSDQSISNSRPPFVVIVGDRQAPGTIELNSIAPSTTKLLTEQTPSKLLTKNTIQCIAASIAKSHCPSKRLLRNMSQRHQLVERPGQRN